MRGKIVDEFAGLRVDELKKKRKIKKIKEKYSVGAPLVCARVRKREEDRNSSRVKR